MVWLPFELHPEVPPEGMPRERLMTAEDVRRAHDAVRRLAAEVGLRMEPSERLINTRLALATAEFAREQGEEAFRAVHHALFKAHWERTAQLDSIPDLVMVASGAGLDAGAVKAALREGRYEEVIDVNRREATAIGINAIPAHMLGRRYLVVGAQPEEVLREVLAKLDVKPGPETVQT